MMTVTSRSEEEVFCDVPVAAEPAPWQVWAHYQER